MTGMVTIEELRKNVALGDLPEEHLQWILDHSEYVEFEDGDLIGRYGAPSDVMWVSIEGKVMFYLNINGRLVYFITFENNEFTGGVGGLLPYSRMKTYPGNSYASGKVRLLRIHRDHFPELERLNPSLIQKLIGYMTERAKLFATNKLQHEKMDALGKLAAGIAHELNNPAAAIHGIADDLKQRLARNYALTQELMTSGILAGEIQKIHEFVKQRVTQEKPKYSSSRRMMLEDEVADWLNEKGLEDRSLAETFTEQGFYIRELTEMSDLVSSDKFVLIMPWLENLISTEKLVDDLQHASGRISQLVSAIKSHAHMDRTSDLLPTDLHQDLENTLTLLGFKLRDKNIEVIKNFDCDMPQVPAYVGELNQVWTNLIDNAVFAMEKNGKLTVETTCDPRTAYVTIIDNGSGIPPDIQTRIFDPFFTTKKIGEGNGIGLDIVDRIVKRHGGEIKLKSVPGRTEFRISLPLTDKPDPNKTLS